MTAKLNKHFKVLVALSGGVDSAVAAAELLNQGFQVTGAYMLNYDNYAKGAESCWLPDYRDAVRVAAVLGIPIVMLDFQKQYKKDVLAYLYQEYQAGRTPNPDVLCNKTIKFGAWLKHAQKLGFNYLATGHYAQVENRKYKVKSRNNKFLSSSFKLLLSKDKDKDQTYFLNQLNQEQLQQAMFPIGRYTKAEVRKLAKKYGLPVANKQESMGICFVGEVPMKEFLSRYITAKPGPIVMFDGEVVGEHHGLPFYTIGQRHIGISCAKHAYNKALYVVGKNKKKNELVVGHDNDPLLYSKETELESVSFVSGRLPKLPLNCQVRLRHRQALQKCQLKKKGQKYAVTFNTRQKAVTPGQFAVFYKNSECLGGGVIC